MQINEVMTPNAECISPDATLHEAAARMKTLDVGSLPVWDGSRLVGMLTDRDITVRSVSDGQDPRKQQVREIMTSEVTFCFTDQDVTEVAKLMQDKQIRRLPVLDRDRRLAGIVSLGDLAVEAGDDRLMGQVLEGISEPAAQR
jgi:CBS domain-containing protein